jgi:hypothetical protein
MVPVRLAAKRDGIGVAASQYDLCRAVFLTYPACPGVHKDHISAASRQFS